MVHSVGHFKNEKSGNIAVHSALKFSKSVEQSGSARLSLIRIKPLILAGKGDLASSVYIQPLILAGKGDLASSIYSH